MHMDTPKSIKRNPMGRIEDSAARPIFDPRSRRATPMESIPAEGSPIKSISTESISIKGIAGNQIKKKGASSAIPGDGIIARKRRNVPTECPRAAEISHRIQEGTNAASIPDDAK